MKFFFKRVLPTPEKLGKNRLLRPLMKRISGAKIWQVNRRSIAGGMASGVFFGALPIPIQIPCAVAAAALCRVNAAVAALATLYSNPLTMPPIFYFNYRIGKWLFGGGVPENLHFSVENLGTMGGKVLMPLFTGSIVVGLVLAVLSYFIVLFWWRWTLVRHYKHRAERKIAALKARQSESIDA